MAGKFELKKNPSGQFMFNLKAVNGRVILTSELYPEKQSAKDGIESVRRYAGGDANFERKVSVKKEPFFVLKAPNGETIGKSEMYSTTAAMENGIASVKKNAPSAVVEDLAV